MKHPNKNSLGVCPQCGNNLEIYSTNEGTNSYEECKRCNISDGEFSYAIKRKFYENLFSGNKEFLDMAIKKDHEDFQSLLDAMSESILKGIKPKK